MARKTNYEDGCYSWHSRRPVPLLNAEPNEKPVHANIDGFASTFRLSKEEKDEVKQIIAENFPASTEGSRFEELARTMEMVETQNQTPTPMGVRYNDSSSLKFANWEKRWRSRNAERVLELSDLQLGQASPASLTSIGNDREDGSLLQAGDDDR